MASAVPPAAHASPSVPERYALPSPPIKEGESSRVEPLEPFRYAIAQFIAEQWEEPVDKILAGVDNGKYRLGADVCEERWARAQRRRKGAEKKLRLAPQGGSVVKDDGLHSALGRTISLR
jgi:hypothetical protein